MTDRASSSESEKTSIKKLRDSLNAVWKALFRSSPTPRLVTVLGTGRLSR